LSTGVARSIVISSAIRYFCLYSPAASAVTAKLRCYLAGAPAGGASPGAAGLLPVVAAPSRDLPEGSPK